MLQSLHIRDLALIDAAEIRFDSGFNVISGETGGGKTLVMRALELLCGAKAAATLVRHGADELRVDGEFVLGDGERSRAVSAAPWNVGSSAWNSRWSGMPAAPTVTANRHAAISSSSSESSTTPARGRVRCAASAARAATSMTGTRRSGRRFRTATKARRARDRAASQGRARRARCAARSRGDKRRPWR